jgi:hypothetical protein
MEGCSMSEQFEVWFQYNKQGRWAFEKKSEAIAFANEHYQNKPVVYDLVNDKVFCQYDIDKDSLKI